MALRLWIDLDKCTVNPALLAQLKREQYESWRRWLPPQMDPESEWPTEMIVFLESSSFSYKIDVDDWIQRVFDDAPTPPKLIYVLASTGERVWNNQSLDV